MAGNAHHSVGVCQCASTRSKGTTIMYYLRNGSRCAFMCNRCWYRRDLISVRPQAVARVCAAGAPVCVRLSGHTARLARPAPPRRLIGPSITAAARARSPSTLRPSAARSCEARVCDSRPSAGKHSVRFAALLADDSTDALMPRRAQQRSRRIFKTDT